MTDAEKLKAPFPYFGGKSVVANIVWNALGQPKHYIEPFFGSGAVLLARPEHKQNEHVETVCDKDGHLANVWRALRFAPDDVAKWADWPVNHADLSARKKRMIANMPELLPKLIDDENYYDAKMAGYWIWAASCWIGSGLTRIGQIPHLTDAGVGVHALGQIPHVSNAGKGVQGSYNTNIYKWFRALCERLRYVRVVCGDWTRVCGGNWQDKIGSVGIYFDPPYAVSNRDGVYTEDSFTIANDVRKWAIDRGKIPSYKIVISGYEEHMELVDNHGWTCTSWSTSGGYGKTAKKDDSEQRGINNRHREYLYFSPNCNRGELQEELF